MRRLPHFHWIYEDGGGIQDPDPKFAHVPPKLIDLGWYGEGRVLTISVTA
jgi:hypothetical protein